MKLHWKKGDENWFSLVNSKEAYMYGEYVAGEFDANITIERAKKTDNWLLDVFNGEKVGGWKSGMNNDAKFLIDLKTTDLKEAKAKALLFLP